MANILVVSEKQSLASNLNLILTFLGETVVLADFTTVTEHLLASSAKYSAVFIDGEASEQAEQVINAYSDLPFINIGFKLDPEGLGKNLLSYLREPLTYPLLSDALEKIQSFNQRIVAAKSDGGRTRLFRSLVGNSELVQEVRQLIEQVAPSDATVMVTGESGTGKEVIARNIHYLSRRSSGPFIPINCGAIPPDLLESELFGHEKGAFTGAINTRKGRFELAQQGTLFLDEIGDMPLPMQVKLLRVLQERTFERVGGTRQFKCDVRIVAATHRNLDEMIQTGRFREDLYYRLNVFPIESPSLSERADDIPLLLNELVQRLSSEGKQSVKFSKLAINSLMQHPWPGNVRELSNVVERLSITCPGKVVDVSDLPRKYRYQADDDGYLETEVDEAVAERDALNALFAEQPSTDEGSELVIAGDLPDEGLNLREYLSELEIRLIEQALERENGVVARAAEHLGMRRTTLVEKMKKYQIDRD